MTKNETASMRRRRREHHDAYYSPTSLVGSVRADRVRYLRGFNDEPQWNWMAGRDPSENTVADPDHEAEAAQLLFEYYRTVRRDRLVRRLLAVLAFVGFAVPSILLGSLTGNQLIGPIGAAIGLYFAVGIACREFRTPSAAGAAAHALEASGYFRDRSPLSEYRITTADQGAMWQALDLERQRAALEDEVDRRRTFLHLSVKCGRDIVEMKGQERELRRRIIELLDPKPSAQEQATSLGYCS